MSVKYALLALLDREPRHGYGLKSEFEARFGQSWPLNIGQVYLSKKEAKAGDTVEAQWTYDDRRRLQGIKTAPLPAIAPTPVAATPAIHGSTPGALASTWPRR